MTEATYKRWANNPWHDLIPRTPLDTYVGIETGIGDMSAQLRQCTHRMGFRLEGQTYDPDKSNLAKHNEPWAMLWSIADQSKALDHGFFLHRSWPHNRVNILSAPLVANVFIPGDPFSYHHGNKSMACLSQLEFRTGDTEFFHHRVFKFIAQQDRYGFSNTWEWPCDMATRYLRWYKGHAKSPPIKWLKDKPLAPIF